MLASNYTKVTSSKDHLRIYNANSSVIKGIVGDRQDGKYATKETVPAPLKLLRTDYS